MPLINIIYKITIWFIVVFSNTTTLIILDINEKCFFLIKLIAINKYTIFDLIFLIKYDLDEVYFQVIKNCILTKK